MKHCDSCGQTLADNIVSCPSCGAELKGGLSSVDDYQIVELIHEGHATILCKATKKGEQIPVMVRIYKPLSGVNEKTVERLRKRLESLKSLPESGFVKHYELKHSAEGLWYRVSEWVESISWSEIFTKGVQTAVVAADKQHSPGQSR